jgi:hypothetical protein
MNKWLRTSGAALKAVAHLDSWKDGSWPHCARHLGFADVRYMPCTGHTK